MQLIFGFSKKYGKNFVPDHAPQTISQVLTGIRNNRYFKITTAKWPFQGIANCRVSCNSTPCKYNAISLYI